MESLMAGISMSDPGRPNHRVIRSVPLLMWKALRLAACCCLATAWPLLLAQDTPSSPPAEPAAKIDLSKVAYRGLSQMERLANQSSVSVDFVNANHVLFTFNNKKLFKRLPQCPASHGDRLVH